MRLGATLLVPVLLVLMSCSGAEPMAGPANPRDPQPVAPERFQWEGQTSAAQPESYNGLQLTLSAVEDPGLVDPGWIKTPALELEVRNVGSNAFQMDEHAPLFLEVSQGSGSWNVFQAEGLDSSRLTAKKKDVFDWPPGFSHPAGLFRVHTFALLPPDNYTVRLSMAIDEGIAARYREKGFPLWQGVARSNAVDILVAEEPPYVPYSPPSAR